MTHVEATTIPLQPFPCPSLEKVPRRIPTPASRRYRPRACPRWACQRFLDYQDKHCLHCERYYKHPTCQRLIELERLFYHTDNAEAALKLLAEPCGAKKRELKPEPEAGYGYNPHTLRRVRVYYAVNLQRYFYFCHGRQYIDDPVRWNIKPAGSGPAHTQITNTRPGCR